jgi:ABC-type transport system involved in cytochrome c biogenesis permease subunit
MFLKSLAAGVVTAAVTFTGIASYAQEPRPDQLVDALNDVSVNMPGSAPRTPRASA